MKKKRLATSIAAVALAVATIFTGSNLPSVKAADVADKTPIDLEIDGKYEEKHISKADSDAINKALGYDSVTNNVIVCGDGSVGYIDWEKSSVPWWKVFRTKVILPDLSRGADGNLIVKKDADGNIVDKLDDDLAITYAGTQMGVAEGRVIFPYVDNGGFNIENPYKYSNSGDINKNMAAITYSYKEPDTGSWVKKAVSDVYILRIYYTTDDKLNYYAPEWSYYHGEPVEDINGNKFEFETMEQVEEYNKDRAFAVADFWILPEGASSVLNFADETPDPAPSDETYTVDLGDSLTVSNDTFNAILVENATKDVVIKSNNNVTFTFAKGTMASVDGKTEYDFSTSIVNAYVDTMPSYITKDNFVSQINFNYSGKLPATANIRFYAGTEYAGQTLYYSLMNADNTFAEVQAVVVDADGYMTVKQDHCSSYVVTKTEPKLPSNDDTKNDDGNTSNNGGSSNNGNTSNNDGSSNNGNASASDKNASSGNTTVSTDKNASSTNTSATSPKTGDMTPIAIYVVMAVAAMGIIVFVKRRKTA